MQSNLTTALSFVDRTVKHGVPVRVALDRGARRFGVNRELLRSFYRVR